jgi:hypothetical protein
MPGLVHARGEPEGDAGGCPPSIRRTRDAPPDGRDVATGEPIASRCLDRAGADANRPDSDRELERRPPLRRLAAPRRLRHVKVGRVDQARSPS